MTRNQRRKAARERKEAKAAKLNAWALQTLQRETVKHNLANPKRPERSPKGMGNRNVYDDVKAAHRVRIFGSGTSYKPVEMSDRQLAAYRGKVTSK